MEKLRYIHQLTGASDFLGQFCVGGLSFENTQRSMKLFAEKIAPVLKNDPAFAPRINDARLGGRERLNDAWRAVRRRCDRCAPGTARHYMSL